jgi:Inner membrane protein YgaP-like, transmembrane domain
MSPMTIDRAVLAFAGIMVLVSALLVWLFGPWWLLLTAFLGANLLQASVTGVCPAAMLFKALGTRPGVAFQ